MPRFLLKRKSRFEIFIVMGFSSIFQQSSVSESKFFTPVVCVFSLQVIFVVLSRRFSSLIQWYSDVLGQKSSVKNWPPTGEHPLEAYCEEHEMKTWKFSVETRKIASIIFEISTKICHHKSLFSVSAVGACWSGEYCFRGINRTLLEDKQKQNS